METTKCKICGNETQYDQTELCDRCWELEHRIEADIEIAKKIIAKHDKLYNAAPDLLEALQSIENDANTIPESIWKMRNDAIQKATSEPIQFQRGQLLFVSGKPGNSSNIK